MKETTRWRTTGRPTRFLPSWTVSKDFLRGLEEIDQGVRLSWLSLPFELNGELIRVHYSITGVHNSHQSWSDERKESSDWRGDHQPSVLIGRSSLGFFTCVFVVDSFTSVFEVGAGHNGLSVAARLKALGVHALVIDRQKRIGGWSVSFSLVVRNLPTTSFVFAFLFKDNWRNRYQSLSLHDPIWCNHLAYLPFPETVSDLF